MTTRVIAEAGVNHNGDPELALRLVDAAAEAGADVIKFQTFTPSELVTTDAPKARYQRINTGSDGSQLEMLERLKLDHPTHHLLLARCRERGVAFLSTPFDRPSLDFLVGELGLTTLKAPSGELTNSPLLLHMARSGADIILSTGMANLAEVEEALGVLAFGYLGGTKPGRSAFAEALASSEGRDVLAAKVSLLHCTTEYPTPPADVNLRAMATLRDTFGLPVGLSDHTEGWAVALAAVALGAAVIEKHLTLDRTLPGPDHRASAEPAELAAMIVGIRVVEQSLGHGHKEAAPSERANMAIARKSLVAVAPIAAGEVFSEANLGAKRPGTGLSPTLYWDMLGKVATRDFSPGQLI